MLVLSSRPALHRRIGPGLLAISHQKAPAYDLERKGMNVKQGISTSIVYKQIHQKPVIMSM